MPSGFGEGSGEHAAQVTRHQDQPRSPSSSDSVSRYWRERMKRRGCVLLAHENLKPRTGPCNVFAHSPYRVSLHRRLNAGIFERTFGQLRLNAVTERFDDNQITVLHGGIISPDRKQRANSRLSA